MGTRDQQRQNLMNSGLSPEQAERFLADTPEPQTLEDIASPLEPQGFEALNAQFAPPTGYVTPPHLQRFVNQAEKEVAATAEQAQVEQAQAAAVAPPTVPDPGALRPRPRSRSRRMGDGGLGRAGRNVSAAEEALTESEREAGESAGHSAMSESIALNAGIMEAEGIRDGALERVGNIADASAVQNEAFQAEGEAINAKHQKLEEDYAAVGDSRTSMQRAGGAIAIALGAIGEGLSKMGGNAGARSEVADMIERQVAADIDRQFKRLDRQGKAIGAQQQQLQMARSAFNDDQAAKQWAVGAEMQAAAAALNSGKLASTAEAITGDAAAFQSELDMRGKGRKLGLAQQELAAKQKMQAARIKAAGKANQRVDPKRTQKVAAVMDRLNETFRTSVPIIERTLAANPDDLPGVGAMGGKLPDGYAGKEARDFRAAIQDVADSTLRKESGAAISIEDKASRAATFGIPMDPTTGLVEWDVWNEDQIREGAQRMINSANEKAAGARAGDPEAFDQYQADVAAVRGSRARNRVSPGAAR